MSNVICNCKEWRVSADQIFGALREIPSGTNKGLAAAHGCNYTGSVFKFCPWCGRHLTPVEAEVLNGVSPDGLYIGDGFGSTWSNRCPKCGKATIQIERPGLAKCSECKP